MKKYKLILLRLLASCFPWLKVILNTRTTQTPIKLKHQINRIFDRKTKNTYWPIDSTSLINNPEYVLIGTDTAPGYMPGCYIQGKGGITIGDYTQIAPHVGLISVNHDLYDSRKHTQNIGFPSIKIGSYCWLGMNAVILPNVELGDFTIVAAGAVVTKSFPEGHCVIGGNPARKIKPLNRECCYRYQYTCNYLGFIPKSKFDAFRRKNLKI